MGILRHIILKILCFVFKYQVHANRLFSLTVKSIFSSQDIDRNTRIKDVSGKSMPAMDVFSLSIKYLKDHCLKTLNSRGVLSNPENVKFVLTVPAIWSDRSKQFMRVAAIEVYICNSNYRKPWSSIVMISRN